MNKIYIARMNDGDFQLILNGKLHGFRNQPALILGKSRAKCWYQHGNLHCLSGPAIKYSDGWARYWIENEKLSKEQFKERIKCLKSMK